MKNNFDFFVGTWTSRQRRLRNPLTGSTDWYEFVGNTRCWSVFDGAGSIDEVSLPDLGFNGLTLRTYDETADEWSLYWINSKTGIALPPQVGRFDDAGLGTFLADDIYDGKPIKVVYWWSAITEDSCRWEQAFSTDGGETWESNWVAEWKRTG